jgi:4-diphosphocytidyl-2-C-methyl-D-erythritol kinase
VEVTVRAPAKINLHLGVGAPREDGFHPLVTVYQAVGLYDDLTARVAPDWSLGVSLPDWMDDDAVPLGGDNIVDRAAALLAAHHGVERTGEIHIAKAIPVAGGMAGGSADGAAALVALDRLWGLGTTDDDLLALAARLGSDVPFALLGGTALGTGRGELVTPVDDRGTWWWVVVPSDTGLPTPEVYRHFDKMFPDAPSQPVPADALLEAIATGDTWALADALHNDLEAAAIDLRPELGRLIERGEEAGALRGLVSGSGPTCVFLCGSADHARSLAADLSGAGHPVVLAANGPVSGAHLVSYA